MFSANQNAEIVACISLEIKQFGNSYSTGTFLKSSKGLIPKLHSRPFVAGVT